MKQLTKEDLFDVLGSSNFQEVEELEILFTNCHEISCLNGFSKLQKLSMIDNGLKIVGNLAPVAMTLTSLCLCDQDIISMDNLDLPNLRELLLHRNCITSISGLQKCTRVKKLWLFQNKITKISGLQALPELEECWIQANEITSLSGLEYNSALCSLCIAGNPVNDFSEVLKLTKNTALQELSLTDIHFGRCNVVNHVGYKDFCIMHFPSLLLLDGVPVNAEKQYAASQSHLRHVTDFNTDLQEIEDSYRRDMQTLDRKQQSRCIHTESLEKEMTHALRELETLTSEGRHAVDKQVARQKQLLDYNYKALEKEVTGLYNNHKHRLDQQFNESLSQESDATNGIFEVLKKIVGMETAVVEAIVGSADRGAEPSSNMVFAVIGEHTIDFQYMSKVLNTKHMPDVALKVAAQGSASAVNHSSTKKNKGNPASSVPIATGNSTNRDPDSVLVKLFRLCSEMSASALPVPVGVNVYCAVSLQDFRSICSFGWDKCGIDVLLFSQPGDAVAQYHVEHATSTTEEVHKHPCTKQAADCQVFLLLCCSLNTLAYKPVKQSYKDIETPMHWYQFLAHQRSHLTDDCCCFHFDVPAKILPSSGASGGSDDDQGRCCYLYRSSPKLNGESLEFLKEPNGLDVQSGVNALFVALMITPATVLSIGQHAASRGKSAGDARSHHHTHATVTGVKGLESRLELLLTPVSGTSTMGLPPSNNQRQGYSSSSNAQRPANKSAIQILAEFEEEVNLHVNRYMHQLLEEVDPSQADSLRDIDTKMGNTEGMTRQLRHEVVKERKQQEVHLREGKAHQILHSEGNKAANNSSHPRRK